MQRYTIYFIWKLLYMFRAVQMSDAVDTVVCASDDGWWYHPKHVEQSPDIV
jgi:hypothetical protein